MILHAIKKSKNQYFIRLYRNFLLTLSLILCELNIFLIYKVNIIDKQ